MSPGLPLGGAVNVKAAFPGPPSWVESLNTGPPPTALSPRRARIWKQYVPPGVRLRPPSGLGQPLGPMCPAPLRFVHAVVAVVTSWTSAAQLQSPPEYGAIWIS